MIKDIAIGAGGLGVDSQGGEIKQSCQQLATTAAFLCCQAPSRGVELVTFLFYQGFMNFTCVKVSL